MSLEVLPRIDLVVLSLEGSYRRRVRFPRIDLVVFEGGGLLFFSSQEDGEEEGGGISAAPPPLLNRATLGTVFVLPPPERRPTKIQDENFL